MQPSSNALVVRTDRAALDRHFRPLAVVQGVLLLVCLAMITVLVHMLSTGFSPSVPLLALAPFVLVAIGSALQLSSVCFLWGVQRTLDEPVVADDSGLRVQTSGGRVHVPWPAVRTARLVGSGRRRRLVLHVDLAAAIRCDLSPRERRGVERRGLVLGGIGLVPGLDAVSRAIATGTAGRVRAV